MYDVFLSLIVFCIYCRAKITDMYMFSIMHT